VAAAAREAAKSIVLSGFIEKILCGKSGII
jgi:hypothetical protein